MSSAEDSVPRYCCDYRDPLNALVSSQTVLRLQQINGSQPFNAVATVSMTLATSKGSQAPCVLRRLKGTCNEPVILDHISVRDKVPPPRPPSMLPTPGHLSLHLQIHDKIGRGRAGGVYSVTIDFEKSSPEIATLAIPPLVAKISRPGQHTRLEHEAYYYEEMECIQGVVIPRCYGFFTGDIPADVSLFPPIEESSNDSSVGGAASDESASHDKCDQRSYKPSPGDNQRPYEPSSCGRIPVSMLLLERLGDRLPIGKKLPDDIKYVFMSGPTLVSTDVTFTQCGGARYVLPPFRIRCRSRRHPICQYS